METYKEEILNMHKSVSHIDIIEEGFNKIDKDIAKVDKAIAKANKALSSEKAQKNPEAKAGAKKVIKELENRKNELVKVKTEKEQAEKEMQEAKTEEAKNKAKMKKLKAEKRYKSFMKAKDPINTICNIIKTASGIAAVVGFFIFASQNAEKNKLFNRLNYYIDNEGSGRTSEHVNNAFRNIGKSLGSGMRYGNKFGSTVTEENKYFNY